MASPRIWTHKVFEGADWQPEDLFAYGDGSLPLAAEIGDIDIRIFLEGSSTLVHSFLGLAPGGSGPFYDTPVLDGGWKLGPPGYNSKHRIEMAVLELADVVVRPAQRYRCEIVLNDTNEGRLISVHEYLILRTSGHP